MGLPSVVGFSEDLGKRMENAIFLELLRDFVVKEGLRITKLIQVTYANDFDEIDKREIRVLLHANELLKKHKPELLELHGITRTRSR